MMLEMPLVLVMVFFSVVCHEIAHGYTALLLGDHTAERMGRLSFNPLVHIDIFGTIILPGILLLSGSRFLFAWAKPVPVNPANFRDPRKGMMLVAMAGPATNLIIAILLSLFFHITKSFFPVVLLRAIAQVSLINILLMVFNLIPIPPLDGSRIVSRFLKGKALWQYMKLERFGMFIVFGLLFTGVLSSILFPAMNLASGLLYPVDDNRRIVCELNNGDLVGGELVGKLGINTTIAPRSLEFQLSQLREIDLLNSSNGEVKLETQDGNTIHGYISSTGLSIRLSSGQTMIVQISDIKKISIWMPPDKSRLAFISM